MGSLAHCLKKMGLAKYESAILRGKVKGLTHDGYEANAAAVQAVKDYIAELEDQRSAVVQQMALRAPVLQRMREEIGWAEYGGRLIRDGDATGGLVGDGDVIGRTPWVPKSDFWPARPDKGLSEKAAHAALDRALEGEQLKPIEQRFVDYAVEVAQVREAYNDAPPAVQAVVEQAVDELDLNAREMSDAEANEFFATPAVGQADASAARASEGSGEADRSSEPEADGRATAAVGSAAAAAEQPAEVAAKPAAFDSEAFDKKRAATLRASRAAGHTHLDQIEPAVETMRGKVIYYAHDPKVTGTIRTVDNHGSVYVDWSDDYSAEREMASAVKEGKRTVMRSSLGPTDLKDYVVGKPTATSFAALQRETITPADDKSLGANDAGEPLYERADGSRYRMHNGKPDFGGDLAPQEAPALNLATQSNDEIVAKEAAQRDAAAKVKADEQAAAAKDQADRERGDFALTGSERAADANAKQDDLLAQASALPPSEPTTPIITAPEDERIADFGEKIGGARKDTAKPLGKRMPKEADERPAWARRYVAMQITADPRRVGQKHIGKWQLMRESGGPRGSVDHVSRQTVYDTEAEALAAIPLAEVARNHRVYGYKDGDTEQFGIYRLIGDRKRALVKGRFRQRGRRHARAGHQPRADHRAPLRVPGQAVARSHRAGWPGAALRQRGTEAVPGHLRLSRW
jgi:hypothetical protein